MLFNAVCTATKQLIMHLLLCPILIRCWLCPSVRHQWHVMKRLVTVPALGNSQRNKSIYLLWSCVGRQGDQPIHLRPKYQFSRLFRDSIGKPILFWKPLSCWFQKWKSLEPTLMSSKDIWKKHLIFHKKYMNFNIKIAHYFHAIYEWVDLVECSTSMEIMRSGVQI